ncbi:MULTISPECIES: polysaccharide deacetylase family protein [Clostridium]|uniref:Polysaccharide deacetylase family protein n=1 Tax=Clostridium cibarium TaxID=2762247 RepID=A0ABR8PYE4_9CLOT|nr:MULTISPECIES: polysaccharide deacetylase family protein [Clostridium]MBD7913193.1 polysaccharide deacetylase family protein [Clostridium cibarium]
MSKAYLTIDDGPTKNTKSITDFLIKKNIQSIMFFTGIQTIKNRKEAIYAIQKNCIVGNHSFTHPHFSELDLDECISEIELQEEQLNLLYKEAGIQRRYRIFRFPYGDKGGKNKDALQKYLKNSGFNKFNDNKITFPWYYESGLNKDIDLYWTFDFFEYKLEYNNGFTFEDIIKEINEMNPKEGAPLLAPDVYNIVLIHDHEKCEKSLQNYFYDIINYVLDQGVEFIKPEFIKPRSWLYI